MGDHDHRTTPGWWLDELTSIGRENLDPLHVSRYDAKEDARAEAELRRLRAAGLGAGSTVVDLGAGTGQFALAAAAAGHRVVAVDPSPVMLDRLRAKATEAAASLEVVRGGFLTYEHHGEPPDLVYSRYALHHLPDFWKAVALDRVRRMLGPDGRFRLWDVVFHFEPDEVDERIEAWCHSLPAGSEWTRAEVEEHVRDECSTFTWLLEPMLERAGFAILEARHAPDGFSAQYLCAPAVDRPASGRGRAPV